MKNLLMATALVFLMSFPSFSVNASAFTEDQKKTWAETFDNTAKSLEEEAKAKNKDWDSRFLTRNWRFFEFLFMLFILGSPSVAVTTTALSKLGAYEGTSVTPLPIGVAIPGLAIIFVLVAYYAYFRSMGLGIVFGMCGFYLALFFDFFFYTISSLF